jgi:hypothetical protein
MFQRVRVVCVTKRVANVLANKQRLAVLVGHDTDGIIIELERNDV